MDLNKSQFIPASLLVRAGSGDSDDSTASTLVLEEYHPPDDALSEEAEDMMADDDFSLTCSEVVDWTALQEVSDRNDRLDSIHHQMDMILDNIVFLNDYLRSVLDTKQ